MSVTTLDVFLVHVLEEVAEVVEECEDDEVPAPALFALSYGPEECWSVITLDLPSVATRARRD